MLSLSQYLLNKAFFLISIFAAVVWISACSSENTQEQASATTGSEVAADATAATSDKGIGPVSTIVLTSAPDQALADKGKVIFEGKCSACHKFGERYVGPDLTGVTQRRKPEWVMNMILNPQEMLQKDATAQELLAQYMTQMPNQNLTEEETRAVLEYFRTK